MLNVEKTPWIEAHGREAVALANICALVYPALTGRSIPTTQFSEQQISEMLRVSGCILQAAPVFSGGNSLNL